MTNYWNGSQVWKFEGKGLFVCKNLCFLFRSKRVQISTDNIMCSVWVHNALDVYVWFSINHQSVTARIITFLCSTIVRRETTFSVILANIVNLCFFIKVLYFSNDTSKPPAAFVGQQCPVVLTFVCLNNYYMYFYKSMWKTGCSVMLCLNTSGCSVRLTAAWRLFNKPSSSSVFAPTPTP